MLLYMCINVPKGTIRDEQKNCKKRGFASRIKRKHATARAHSTVVSGGTGNQCSFDSCVGGIREQ